GPDVAVRPDAAAPGSVGAGGAASEAGGGDAMSAYVAQIRDLVRRHQDYPALARRRGIEGLVLVRLEITSDGRVGRAAALNGANALLARSAVAAARRAAPFPPPPHGAVAIDLPIRWQ